MKVRFRTINDCVTQRTTLATILPALAKTIGAALGKDPEKLEFIRKFYPAEKVETEDKERAVIGVINTATQDRDREILEPEGAVLKDYAKNRVVLWAHRYDSFPVGVNQWIKRKKGVGLVAKTIIAKRPPDLQGDWLPDQIYHLAKQGVIRAFSVGFIPLAWEEYPDNFGSTAQPAVNSEGKPEEGGTMSVERKGLLRRFTEWLLLEYSFVPVPSNPDAVVLEAKSGKVAQQIVDDFQIEIEEDGEETIPAPAPTVPAAAPTTGEPPATPPATPPAGEMPAAAPATPPAAPAVAPAAASAADPDEIEVGDDQEEKATKPEETENAIHIPVRPSKDFVKESFRTIDISKPKGIKAVIGKLKSEPDGPTEVQQYVFDKDKGWNMESARAWVDDHKEAGDIIADAAIADKDGYPDADLLQGSLEKWLGSAEPPATLAATPSTPPTATSAATPAAATPAPADTAAEANKLLTETKEAIKELITLVRELGKAGVKKIEETTPPAPQPADKGTPGQGEEDGVEIDETLVPEGTGGKGPLVFSAENVIFQGKDGVEEELTVEKLTALLSSPDNLELIKRAYLKRAGKLD
jgi:hypothetical protein